jgi:hypothetical protein
MWLFPHPHDCIPQRIYGKQVKFQLQLRGITNYKTRSTQFGNNFIYMALLQEYFIKFNFNI